MRTVFITTALAAAMMSAPVLADHDNDTLDAAIGGGLGGAAGAAIGNEIGGRDGAILGGAIGGAAGSAVTTRDNDRHDGHFDRVDRFHDNHRYYQPPRHPHGGRFCPPGQAKKGRC